tara:strand:+ start:253 stop:804 length:552 start_codon:yes stop_codon:yes gene_type:complete
MAFTNNTTYGTTAYSTGTFFDQSLILANDGSSLSSATLATVSELAIPLGAYERVQGIYTLWYDSDDTNELSYRIANLAQSDGSTAVATTIATQSIASVAEITSGATPSAAGLESTGTYSTDGAGETVGVDVGAATSALWLQVHFNALVTAATKGKLSLQLANITGTAAGTHLLAGSNVVYKKW